MSAICDRDKTGIRELKKKCDEYTEKNKIGAQIGRKEKKNSTAFTFGGSISLCVLYPVV